MIDIKMLLARLQKVFLVDSRLAHITPNETFEADHRTIHPKNLSMASASILTTSEFSFGDGNCCRYGYWNKLVSCAVELMVQRAGELLIGAT